MRPEVEVEAVRYRVSCIPYEHDNAHGMTLWVEKRGDDRWCVTDGSFCYRKDGHASYESNPSSRTDRFKKAYRFSFEDAMALARRLAPKKQIGPWTVEDILLGREKPTGRMRRRQ